MSVSISGEYGHNVLFTVVRAVYEGFDLTREESRELIVNEFNPRCQPPWPEYDIDHKLDEVERLPSEHGRGYKLKPYVPNVSPVARGAAPNGRPVLYLPSDHTEIRESAQQIGAALATGGYFSRYGQLVKFANDELAVIEPAQACSTFEEVGELRAITGLVCSGGSLVPIDKNSRCSIDNAKKIMACDELRQALPEIRVLSHSPVLTADGRVVCGYDPDTGIYANGSPPPEVPVEEAARALSGLLTDWRFVTDADRGRAVAAMLTPAVIFGRLLGDVRCPAFGVEADASQAGKGYFVKLIGALYGTTPRTITQKKTGVGGLEEDISGAVMTGAPLVCLDNLRDKIDSPMLESTLTESSIEVRVPYKASFSADPTGTAFAWTSNKAQMTPDLANRSNIIRIAKRSQDESFREYEGGDDLLDHVRRNQAYYLGCIFAIFRDWMDKGRCRGDGARRHDFHCWAGMMLWITDRWFGCADMLAGHGEVQHRATSPIANWLRDLALAVKASGKLGPPLRANCWRCCSTTIWRCRACVRATTRTTKSSAAKPIGRSGGN